MHRHCTDAAVAFVFLPVRPRGVSKSMQPQNGKTLAARGVPGRRVINDCSQNTEVITGISDIRGEAVTHLCYQPHVYRSHVLQLTENDVVLVTRSIQEAVSGHGTSCLTLPGSP